VIWHKLKEHPMQHCSPGTRGLFTIPALALAFAGMAFGQFKAPRTWYDQPDLEGIWEVANPRAAADIEAAKIIVDPKNGKLPYTKEALAQRAANKKAAATMDSVNKCFMPGVPRLMYMGYPFQIFQTKDQVVVTSEYVHNVRNIWMARKEHLDGLEFWNGDSIGHWDGDSLATSVSGFNADTWFDKAGNHHSTQLSVNEKFTRTSATDMTYEATITDPATFTAPFTIRVPFKLNTKPNARIMEYECNAIREHQELYGTGAKK
jgi:hypothetical protein